MAIKVNGLLVAGLGKSAYEQAQEGGYTGTEEEFISALANIGSNPTAEGLPVNDVRTGTVRDGQSIAAGDVVNVQDGEIYHDVVAQKNVENQLNTVVMTGSDLFKLNESYSILLGNSSSNPAAYLIDNTTGKSIYSVSVHLSAVLSISGARLDDSHFVVQYITDSIAARVCTVNGSTISVGGNFGVQAPTTSNMECLVSLSSDTLISIFNKPALTVRPFKYFGNSLSFVGNEAPLPNNTGADHISATRIPDDDSGNKRVCICFSDTGDGNKGKAVIATVDSANAVTFGDVVMFSGVTIYATSCAADKTGNILVGYIKEISSGSKKTAFVIFNTELKAVSNVLSNHGGSINLIQAVVCNENNFLGVSDNQADLLGFSGEELTLLKNYSYNANTPDCLSAAAIEKSKILIAFANRSNSSYGTTTILEIFGNQIAGSFLNNSKDAIALESGEGGDTIKLGFGGYCACEGITAGQMIDSEGVTAYSPLDGWLKIIPWQEQAEPEIAPYVIGEYTGNGASPTVIDVGFMPSVFIIGAILTESNYTTQIDYQYCVLFRGDDLFIANISRKNFSNATWKATGIEMTDSGSGAKDRFNESGVTYRYIAFR